MILIAKLKMAVIVAIVAGITAGTGLVTAANLRKEQVTGTKVISQTRAVAESSAADARVGTQASASSVSAVTAGTVVYQQGAGNAFVANYTGTADATIANGSPDGNRGQYGMSLQSSGGTMKGLLRFDLSSFAGKYSTVSSITLELHITQAINTTNGTIYARAILPANSGWVQGTANGATQAGACCWNYAKYNTQAWAGTPGLGTSGVDYDSVLLGSFVYTGVGSYTMTFAGNACYLTSLISSWANATNPGILLTGDIPPASTGFVPYVYIYGSEDSNVSSRPKLTINYNNGTGLWSGATDLGNGWKRLSWFGDFVPYDNGWIWHNEHGWLYCVGTCTSNLWIWSSRLGWVWTSDSLYPFLWSSSGSAWLWYYKGTGNGSGGWFYNYGTGQVEWK